MVTTLCCRTLLQILPTDLKNNNFADLTPWIKKLPLVVQDLKNYLTMAENQVTMDRDWPL